MNDLTEAFAHPRAQRTALTGVLANGQALRAVSSLAFEGGFPGKTERPPALGAHTDEVLRTTLGYPKAAWRCYGPKACLALYRVHIDITPVSATFGGRLAGGAPKHPTAQKTPIAVPRWVAK